MHAVPGALREAAFGIGARRRTVTTQVVFPAAVSGIVAALILGHLPRDRRDDGRGDRGRRDRGRARTFNPLGPGQTMTGAIASLAIGSDQVQARGRAQPSILFFVGLLLFVITLGPQPGERAVRAAGAEGY